MFVIEDEMHADTFGRYATRGEAEAELRRLASLPWNEEPNVCPCTSWRTCGRRYHLIEYDTAHTPWRKLAETPALEVSATGTRWLGG
jgi:hypothetical protein